MDFESSVRAKHMQRMINYLLVLFNIYNPLFLFLYLYFILTIWARITSRYGTESWNFKVSWFVTNFLIVFQKRSAKRRSRLLNLISYSETKKYTIVYCIRNYAVIIFRTESSDPEPGAYIMICFISISCGPTTSEYMTAWRSKSTCWYGTRRLEGEGCLRWLLASTNS